ncbi:MAG: putative 7-carboxy-7-deazaguanine synthase QueE [Trichococcus flocculiformis]|jgi:7-carboxy-7-deazaguanine synthase|uniref:7-carboxy-7-deazaguanine synthase n=1 Tax=Trichococcus shcherbakoviae TaxID=2094020 RepID=A0A383TDR2_9LACT|nr:putative 7-carboxy-7-deazaguanine synthase QueE [Trichococcus shcherbakoviae]MBP8683627.1 putative 7-carboxy-7-deazaguanine synthase QueE [Trichococcus sp.]SYZ77804.1 radical sam [Trichococcus shcherbakoviae]
MVLQVVEKFISINGEGRRCGQLATFIRFAGCNLNCGYCDTAWANDRKVAFDPMTAEEVYAYIKETQVTNVTLTGGEPLLQQDMGELLELLSQDPELYVEIETNGSVLLSKFSDLENPPSFTMDYKLPSSGMERMMALENFDHLTEKDTVKFVSGSMEDLEKARELINKYKLTEKTSIFISPVFGDIELESIVDFMKDNQMNGVNMQVQLHKIIWDPNERGV